MGDLFDLRVGALVQLPLWITFFFTMRHLVRQGSGLGLEDGGTLWFTDLTARYPTFVLPGVMGVSFFAMASLGDPGQASGATVDPRQAQMRNMMKVAAFVMVPATAWFESGVFVYWISTNAATITQTLLLRQPVVRSISGLPPLPPLPPAAAATAAASTGLLGQFSGIVPGPLRGALGLPPPPATTGLDTKLAPPPPREAPSLSAMTTDVSSSGSLPLERVARSGSQGGKEGSRRGGKKARRRR